ncbi:outer membrane beta-barrel family protein [Robiginitalea sp. M366]|uniref:outer membrane beta-barrel family protein n=1 Tax=Robiginitalea aestuariiviva TaxID=3036903 RepID=UPI00240D858F|nr:outer membrane beta-barrel family protein [Robiginitalea aestuariiviva]MDG1571536.1 outer membrane beta-barrel family protein [Robiginitalea aestuariiviva]
MKTYILLILGLLPLALTGQQFQISGTLKDSEGKALPYSNVILLRAADSVQVKGTSADESGIFVLRDVPGGSYLLQPQYFGHKSLILPLELTADLQLGEVVLELEGNALDEVVITAARPIIERLADRLVFKVENTVISEGTTWDILRRTPGVVVLGDNLEIRGKSVTVYLNDRKVQLSSDEILDLLKGLSGDVVSAVEVIADPPARYEAADGAVLNIRTRQNIVPGYKGSVQARWEQAIFPKYRLGTSHYYKGRQWGLFANYSISPRKEFKRTDSYVNFFDPAQTVYARWNTDMEKIGRSLAQQATLMLDYSPSEKDQFNLTTTLNTSPNKRNAYLLATVMRNAQGQVDSTLRTWSNVEDDMLNASANLNYERKLAREGASLKANAHYTYYELRRDQVGNSDYFNPSGAFQRNFRFSTEAFQDIHITTAQADYYAPQKSGSFEAGAKGSFIRSNSRIDYLDVNDTQPPFDIALSDRFTYDEAVGAAYMTLNRDWDPWSLKLGLRAEHTEVRARSLTLDDITRQSYLEFFPSVYLGRTLGEDNSLNFSYNRRLTRPNYQDLNPFRFFLNENDYDEGNPNLVPNFSHNLNLNLTLKNTVFIDFYYRDNGRYISLLSFQDNEAQTLLQIIQNVYKSRSYGVDFTVSASPASFWDLYAYTSVFHEAETFLAVESDIETYTNRVSGFYGYFNNAFTLSKDRTFTADLTLVYLSGFLYGTYRMSENTTLNAGLRKSLWKGRAIVSLVAEDILQRANSTYTTRYNNQDNGYYGLPETRFVRLGFTYNFGNYRLQNRSADLRKSELQRIEDE